MMMPSNRAMTVVTGSASTPVKRICLTKIRKVSPRPCRGNDEIEQGLRKQGGQRRQIGVSRNGLASDPLDHSF